MMEDISQGLELRPILYDPCGGSANGLFPAKFWYVRRNIPGPGSERGLFEEQLCGCDCLHGCQQDTCSCLQQFGPNYHPHTGQLTPEAGTSSTLKPVLECNSQCACDAGCSNRLVQHGPRVKLKVSHAGRRGFGLFACEGIRQLTFVCEYAGEVIGSSEACRRMESKDGSMNYLIVLREHCHTGIVLTCVDPEHIGNIGRFANHSCDPNLVMVPVRVDNSIPKLALFARRNIHAGDELTFDYSGESVVNGVLISDIHPTGVQMPVDACESKLFTHSETSVKVKSRADTENDSGPYVENEESCDNHENRVVDCCVEGASASAVNGEPFDSTGCAGCCNYSARRDVSENCRTDHPPDPQVANTDSTNQRKRKRLHSEGTSNEDRVKAKNRNELFDRESLAEHGVENSDAGMNQTALKVCLCGTSQCKGYLPFDPFIFNS